MNLHSGNDASKEKVNKNKNIIHILFHPLMLPDRWFAHEIVVDFSLPVSTVTLCILMCTLIVATTQFNHHHQFIINSLSSSL